jgi:hypothetical protein
VGRQLADEEKRWEELVKTAKFLVHVTHDFIVRIDADGDVDWKTGKEWDDVGPTDSAKHSAILNEGAVIETTPCDFLTPAVKLQFKRLIGEAYARTFVHDYAAANAMLLAARNFVRARSEEVARTWYLEASLVTAGVIIGLAFSAWIGRQWTTSWFGVSGLWLVLSFGSGALGALLSVIVRSGRLEVDCAAGRYLHRVEGASRVLAGSASGFLTGLAVMSGLFLASFTKAGNMAPVMLLASFIGGTTERLASSIVARVAPAEKTSGQQRERTQERRR